MTTESADVRIRFVSALARALARCGEDADDLERDLTDCAVRLGLDAQFFATPTMVMASFGSDDHERTVRLRVSEGRIDLQARSMMQEIVDGVKAGEKTAPQALAEINLIAASPPRFAWWVRVLASGLGAASFAIFLGGDWRTLLAALPVGLAVGMLVVVAARYERLRSLMELLGGLVAAVVTLAVGHLFNHFSLPTVALAGVILLLPGLSITIGVSELASRHLTSGTSRLAGAAVTLVNLGVGSFLGFALVDRLGLVPATGLIRSDQTTAAFVVAVAATGLASLIFTNSRTRDWPIVFAGVIVALLGARFGAWLVGASLGVAIASLALGLSANVYARLSHRPAALLLIPGLAVLVPGALGLRGVGEFLRTASGGLNVLTSVVIIAAGLVVGLLMADAALPPHRAHGPLDPSPEQAEAAARGRLV